MQKTTGIGRAVLLLLIMYSILFLESKYLYANSKSPPVWLDENQTYALSRNIDGDTIELFVNGAFDWSTWWNIFTWWKKSKLTVRMIGINSPESVDPKRPAECGGKEASVALGDLLHKYLNEKGRVIRLIQDHSQSNQDVFGRTLAYVEVIDQGENSSFSPIDINLEMLHLGYAKEFTYGSVLYHRHDKYVEADRQARIASRGIWGLCQNQVRNEIGNAAVKPLDKNRYPRGP